ncbi:MAG TPA: gluconate 2-dehydrogenase subunit 3 family protein [Steroidobacteraceae bacterium]|jgi:hypothetical protein
MTSHGYGGDPDLQRRQVSWPRILSASHLDLLHELCDWVLPAEPPHRSAGELGVQHFIDEWLGAPYPQMQADREMILNGLEALSRLCDSRLGLAFTVATADQQTALFKELCTSDRAFSAFGRRLVELICAGYYTTRDGHAAIGYIGNVPLDRFPAPPEALVQQFARSLDEDWNSPPKDNAMNINRDG